MKIDVKGPVVPNAHKPVYDYYGIQCVCPADVQASLDAANGEPVVVYINSGGGDVFAGAEIYTALMDYPGDVELQIVGLAASAASVIAMARRCVISPVGQIMVHNVSSAAEGDYRAMHHTGDVLDNANDALANAYMRKSGLPREKIRQMMDEETWLTAPAALKAGLVDEIMGDRLVAAVETQTLPYPVIKKTLAQLQTEKAAALETARNNYKNLLEKEL